MLQIERIGDKVRFRRVETIKRACPGAAVKTPAKVRIKQERAEAWLIACEEYSERKTLWRT
ncbi:MAG TPA: hypothetical protein DEV87_04835 [Clostridiales bacterium]|nr:hypothetical protein [Clostridiales bacterium]